MYTRRYFIVSILGALTAACQKPLSTSPTSQTTPLAEVLRAKGNTVTVERHGDGSLLVINGKKPKIIVGGKLIGVEDNFGGKLNFDVANWPVPDGIEPTFA